MPYYIIVADPPTDFEYAGKKIGVDDDYIAVHYDPGRGRETIYRRSLKNEHKDLRLLRFSNIEHASIFCKKFVNSVSQNYYYVVELSERIFKNDPQCCLAKKILEKYCKK